MPESLDIVLSSHGCHNRCAFVKKLLTVRRQRFFCQPQDTFHIAGIVYTDHVLCPKLCLHIIRHNLGAADNPVRSPAQPPHAVFFLQGAIAADTHPDFILYSRKDVRQIGGGAEAVCDFYFPFSFYFFNGTDTFAQIYGFSDLSRHTSQIQVNHVHAVHVINHALCAEYHKCQVTVGCKQLCRHGADSFQPALV